MSETTGSGEELLLPSEVAQLFRVDVKTVNRWAVAGKLTYVRTVGGHKRFYKSEVMKYLAPQGGNNK